MDPKKGNICNQSCVINALNVSSFGLKFSILSLVSITPSVFIILD